MALKRAGATRPSHNSGGDVELLGLDGRNCDYRSTITQLSRAEARSSQSTDASFGGLAYGNSFIGAFVGRLPISAIAAEPNPLLLLKLIRSGQLLSGTVVAYSSPQRLNHLLPFYMHLQRDPDKAVPPQPGGLQPARQAQGRGLL